jgi:chromosome segregation ATPase
MKAQFRAERLPGASRHNLKEYKMKQNERDTIKAEIEALDERLTGLRAEKDQLLARRANSRDYIPIPGLSPILENISEAECKLRSLQDKLAHIDRVSAYRLAVETAGARSDEARRAAEDAGARADELEARIARLKQRIEAIQTESAAAEGRAQEVEAAASRAYARAISEGGAEEEKIALSALEKARAKVFAVQSRAKSDAGIIAALGQEISELEKQAADARAEADAQRGAMIEADLVGLRAEWDRVAGSLLDVGRRIAQVADTGGLPSGLSSLHVPLFRPDRNFIAERDTREVS